MSHPLPALFQGPASQPRLVAIPRLAAGGRWRVEAMRTLSEPCLLWFTRGQGRITVAGVTRGYGANTAVFLPAGVMHGFEVGPQTFGTAIFFGSETPLHLPNQPHHLRIRENTAQLELNHALDAIAREMASAKPASERAVLAHLHLLSVWLERQIAQAPTEETPLPASARRLVSRFTDLLERDFKSGAGVGDYASALGVTPTHLSRVCRATSGKSAKELLSDRLLFEARKMLSETQIPVQEVASRLGFGSAAYFTRAFQHHTGKTPTDFRRLH